MTSHARPPAIRRAIDADVELIIDRRLQFFCEMRGWERHELDADFLAANRDFIERTHCRTFHSWLVEDDSACIGIVSVVVSDAPPRPEELRHLDGYVINMHVDAAQRSRGIGRMLVDVCMRECEEMGVRRFSLFATDEGRPLYESTGFSDEVGWMNRYV